MCTYNIFQFNKWVFFTIFFFHKLLNYFLMFHMLITHEHVEMNKFLCSLACTWMTIIDSQFYIIDILSEMFHWNEMLHWWLPGCINGYKEFFEGWFWKLILKKKSAEDNKSMNNCPASRVNVIIFLLDLLIWVGTELMPWRWDMCYQVYHRLMFKGQFQNKPTISRWMYKGLRGHLI